MEICHYNFLVLDHVWQLADLLNVCFILYFDLSTLQTLLANLSYIIFDTFKEGGIIFAGT